jgi:hypothetical protein
MTDFVGGGLAGVGVSEFNCHSHRLRAPNPVRTDRMPRDLDTLSKDMRGFFAPPIPTTSAGIWKIPFLAEAVCHHSDRYSPARLIGRAFPCAADIVGHHHTGAPTMPRPAKQPHSNLSDQPFVTMGGGALPLPTPTQPATLTATRVATKAISTFFIGVPLSSRHAMHTSCLAAPLVVRCPQWFTASVDSGALRRGLCP